MKASGCTWLGCQVLTCAMHVLPLHGGWDQGQGVVATLCCDSVCCQETGRRICKKGGRQPLLPINTTAAAQMHSLCGWQPLLPIKTSAAAQMHSLCHQHRGAKPMVLPHWVSPGGLNTKARKYKVLTCKTLKTRVFHCKTLCKTSVAWKIRARRRNNIKNIN